MDPPTPPPDPREDVSGGTAAGSPGDASSGPPPEFRGIYRTDGVARAVYSEAAGIARVMPRAVAIPANPEDVSALVRWARRDATPLIPRGSGSSMPGGAIGDGVIVDLSRLDWIEPVDPVGRTIATGPGTVRDAVDAAARHAQLRFPVDPSSGAFCTVGGMASTNAAGARTLRHGATRAWVAALDCVFEDGSRAVVRRGAPPPAHVPAVERFLGSVASDLRSAGNGGDTADTGAGLRRSGLRKDSSGYALADYVRSGELVDLLVGSEGTLALFVGVELALAPLPRATASALAAFASLDDAVAAAGVARDGGASACELLDRTFLDVAAKGGPLPVPADSEAVLLIELEGDGADAAASAAKRLARALERTGATRVTLGLDAAKKRELWVLRHAASPILSRLGQSFRSMQFIEDGAVPPDRLADYVRGVRAALEKRGVPGVIFGHAGDAHVHVNPLVDVTREGWRDQVAGLLNDVVELTARLGGTLAGEHGDGRLRAPLVDRTASAAMIALGERVKRAFDPRAFLNPGAKVALPGQEALGTIKYDPLLAPLPAPAARALERVERERAYAEFRLAMLEERDPTR